MSLRAFNIEIASIKSSQSTELAELKMKWWKDAIDTIYKGEVVNHPVLLILKEVIERNKLSKTWFLKILDARSKDLRVTQPSHLSDIEDYAEATYSSLLYLALESAGLRNIDADHAASHLGKAFGMVTILRAIPYQLKHQHIDVPKDMMIKHKFSAEQLLRGDMTSEGRNVIYEVADIANQHIELARSMKDQVPSAAKIVFLPTVSTSFKFNDQTFLTNFVGVLCILLDPIEGCRFRSFPSPIKSLQYLNKAKSCQELFYKVILEGSKHQKAFANCVNKNSSGCFQFKSSKQRVFQPLKFHCING